MQVSYLTKTVNLRSEKSRLINRTLKSFELNQLFILGCIARFKANV